MGLPYERQFHFHDGSSVEDLEGLMRRLSGISYTEFYRHVNPDKNDFASWIRHVLGEPQLAQELERVSSIVETIEIINDHLHPRPIEIPKTDAQSRIEESVLGPAALPVTIQDTPPVARPSSPAIISRDGGADFTIFEQSLDGGPASRVDAALPPMQEPEQEQAPTVQERAPVMPQPSIAVPAAHDDLRRMIVRDFIWGFFIGLIVGAILGRMVP